MDNAAYCAAHGRPIVIGTTGFTAQQKSRVLASAEKVPLCMARNFSTGVNLCFRLLETAAQVLGEGVDIEIVEAHHHPQYGA